MQSIRVAVWAVIVRDDKILLVEFDDPNAELRHHYNLPGGGVEVGETLQEAVSREVYEETNASVTVGEMLFIYEYVPTLEQERYGNRQIVRPIFHCTLHPDSEPHLPDHPDEFEIGVQWVALDQLDTLPLIPPIGTQIREALQRPNPRNPYLPSSGTRDERR
jgi:8-oxo-dGTP pyrophosphatase MutT (NUDIX family)